MLGKIECILWWKAAKKGAEITQQHGLERRIGKTEKCSNLVKLLPQKEELDHCVSRSKASSYRSDCISKVMRGFILYNIPIPRDVKFVSKLNYFVPYKMTE